MRREMARRLDGAFAGRSDWIRGAPAAEFSAEGNPSKGSPEDFPHFIGSLQESGFKGCGKAEHGG